MEKPKTTRIYLSLPISGYDLQERIDTAMQMEVKLRGLGYDVFNPLGDGWMNGLSTHEYMKHDLKALLNCDAIFIMKGWNRSAGCKLELDTAVAIGIDVFFEEQVNIQL